MNSKDLKQFLINYNKTAPKNNNIKIINNQNE